jgi:hypothetical protein
MKNIEAGFEFFCYLGCLFIEFLYKNKTHFIFYFVKTPIFKNFFRKKKHKMLKTIIVLFFTTFVYFFVFFYFFEKNTEKNTV